jgi:hypothetical protein
MGEFSKIENKPNYAIISFEVPFFYAKGKYDIWVDGNVVFELPSNENQLYIAPGIHSFHVSFKPLGFISGSALVYECKQGQNTTLQLYYKNHGLVNLPTLRLVKKK